MQSQIKIIALYLPQYHPTQSNNKWYGEGFTEWTNVAKAKSLFPGHEQPKIPSDLGFYDLRLPEARKAQANLAEEYGISAFCYYYYRFNANHHELETPLTGMLHQENISLPFMICWVNETWYKKFWSADGSYSSEILAEQQYGDEKDYTTFFYEVLPYFRDTRYLKIHGKIAFMIYNPLAFDDIENFLRCWNNLSMKENLPGFFFLGFTSEYDKESAKLYTLPFHGIVSNRLYSFKKESPIIIKKVINFFRRFIRIPHIVSYKKASKYFLGQEISKDNVYPTIIPNWDHTPRSGTSGWVFHKSTPNLFKKNIEQAIARIKHKKEENQIIFIKSWNEWGEGNYMEPDLKWGRQYLEVLKNTIEETSRGKL